jgi:hypothetical protein
VGRSQGKCHCRRPHNHNSLQAALNDLARMRAIVTAGFTWTY